MFVLTRNAILLEGKADLVMRFLRISKLTLVVIAVLHAPARSVPHLNSDTLGLEPRRAKV